MISFYSIASLAITSFFSILFLDFFAKKFNLFDLPQKFKIHKKKITKTSGFGIIFLIINCFLLFDYSNELNNYLNILIFVILIGFYDDIKNLDATSKITLMIIPALIFIYQGGQITTLGQYKYLSVNLKSLSIIFTICCILLLTNAFNYMDGMDGLLGTISLTSLLFFLAILPNDEIKFIIPFIIFLSVFLFFNLGIIKSLPQVFIGDSGSQGIGFLFCIISIHYTQNLNYIHESIIIWPMALVVYEFLTINIIRIKNKKNPFERDLNFLFNHFLISYTKLKTLILCNTINLFFCGLGYYFYLTKYYEVSIFLFIIFYFVYFFFRVRQVKS